MVWKTSFYCLTVFADEKYRQAQLGLYLVISKAKIKMLSQDAEFLSGDSGEEFSFSITWVVGWIQFLVILGLKSLFHVWLSASICFWFLNVTGISFCMPPPFWRQQWHAICFLYFKSLWRHLLPTVRKLSAFQESCD